VQEAGHPQEIEKAEEEGRKLLVDLVKLAKIAISPALTWPGRDWIEIVRPFVIELFN
jgi:hypothetical protein